MQNYVFLIFFFLLTVIMKHLQAKSQRTRQHPTTEIHIQVLLTITVPIRGITTVQIIQAMEPAVDSMTGINKAIISKVMAISNGEVMDHLIREEKLVHSYKNIAKTSHLFLT